MAFTLNIGTAYGRVERTAKGGLHVIRRQTDPVPPAAAGATVNFPPAVLQYIIDHRNDHQFYFSLWSRVTRTAGGTRPVFGGMTNIDANYLFIWSPEGDLPSGPTRLGSRSTNPAGLGDAYRSMAVSGPVDNYGVAAGYEGALWRSGGNIQWTAGGTGSMQSQIFYCAYVEDLTISGRTWAQVDAIDLAFWQQSIGAGFLANDTFTNPALFP